MSIERQLRADFELGMITEIRNMSTSNSCYLVVTDDGSFVFKQAGRLDFVKAYDKAVQVLHAQGFIAARLLRTRQGSLATDQGFSLAQYIAGDTPESFDDNQFHAAVQYIGRYNSALRAVPFTADELQSINIWDQAKSTGFLCENIETLLARCNFQRHDREILSDAGKLLVENRSYLEGKAKQLIHTDLGPGNLVFSRGQVKAIIDFTPEYENELYSLAQFLFWTCLWKGDEEVVVQKLRSALSAYYEKDREQSAGVYEELFVYLLKACLFRTFGPILNMLEQGRCDTGRVASRIQAVRILFEVKERL